MPKLSIKKNTDPYINNVSLFLPFNSNFNDNSSNNFSITAYGDAQISSTQSKFGGSSAYFDGDGDYLLLEDDNAFIFNNDLEDYPSIPFTIEAWIYPLTLSSETASVIISKDTYGSNFSWCIALYNDRIGVYTHDISDDWQFEANTTVLTNTWQHVALSMDGTTQRLFLNGQLVGTKNAPITNRSSKITIGCFSWNNTNSFYNGYIDDLRITKGVARYTSNFAPRSILTNNKLQIINAQGFSKKLKIIHTAPAGIPVASTSSIAIAGYGTFVKKVGGEEVTANGLTIYDGVAYTNLNIYPYAYVLFGPPPTYMGDMSINQFSEWTLYSVGPYEGGDVNAWVNGTLIASSTSNDITTIPTNNWSPSITITSA
jgi:hypothetical protein